MAKEIEALEENTTWSVEVLRLGKHNIFRVKYKPEESIKRYRAQLVIQGDEKIEGFDCLTIMEHFP